MKLKLTIVLCYLFSLSAWGDGLDERVRDAIFDGNISRLRTLIHGVDLSTRGPTYLQDATFFKRTAAIRVLVEAGVNVDALDAFGRTALMDAVESKPVDMNLVTALVSLGANVNAIGQEGDVLAYAARGGSTAVLRFLISKGAVVRPPECSGGMNSIMAASAAGNLSFLERMVTDVRRYVNRRGNLGQTALMMAVKEGKFDTYKYLLEQGADWNINDNDGNSLLMLAIDGGNLRIVRDLLDKGLNVNHMNNYRNNPLLRAIMRNSPEIIKLLMEKGADASIPTGAFNKLPIVEAMSSFTKKAFDELVKHLNQAQLWQGFTALTTGVFRERHHWDEFVKRMTPDENQSKIILAEAGGFNDLNTIKKLKKAGVDLDSTDGRTGETALMKAMKRKNNQVAQYLLSAGATFDRRNAQGDNALLMAAAAGNAEGVRLLVRAGMRVEDHDMQGNTPLIRASQSGERQTVQALLSVGANIDAPGVSGRTALYYAIANRKVELVRTLLNSCASVSQIDSSGTNPETLARQGFFSGAESDQIVRLLEQRRQNSRCH